MNIDNMDETEKDYRKAFEAVTTGNVKAALDYCKKTREMVRELQETLTRQNNIIASQNENMNQFRIQLAGLQQKVYNGGT